MKYSSTFVLITALLAGCSKPATPPDTSTLEKMSTPQTAYPTLVIDEQHQIRGKDTPPAYQIAASSGIYLDASQFHFTYGTNVVTPNMVQLVENKSAYRLSQPTETNIYVIDHTTLEAVKGAAFRGFQPGDHVMFAIGRSKRGPEKEEFWVSWAGQIEVK